MSQRFSILDQLNDNWPGKFPPARMSLFEKALADFDVPTLGKGVQAVLRKETFPPTVAVVYQACAALAPAAARRRGNETLVAGGPVPGRPGERFLTVDEMVGELERMRSEHPEVFGEEPESMKVGRKLAGERLGEDRLKYMINRIYVRALERGIRNNGRPIEATQAAFF